MYLFIVVIGYDDDDEGAHVSILLCLMNDPYDDDELEESGHWPLRGTFTKELLYQLNYSDHYSHILYIYTILSLSAQ